MLNGLRAFCLFDPGSNVDSISPNFARSCNAKVFTFADAITLQLGVKGSKSKLQYGTYLQSQLGPINKSHYFDISNIDHYDCILGMPFLHIHKVVMDLGQRSIIIGGVTVEPMKEGGRVKEPSKNNKREPGKSAPKGQKDERGLSVESETRQFFRE